MQRLLTKHFPFIRGLNSRWVIPFTTIFVARTLGNFQGTFNYIEEQKNAWSPTNTVTDIPKVSAQTGGGTCGQEELRPVNNATVALNGDNSRFYEKGDYLACREITLSSGLPRTMLSKTHLLSQARVYVSTNNLFYITKFTGPTPEPPVSNNLINGIYAGTYPTPKTFVLGVHVAF